MVSIIQLQQPQRYSLPLLQINDFTSIVKVGYNVWWRTTRDKDYFQLQNYFISA
ncbi:MAG: hypothetical protein ACXAEU_15820 [Candidatus Hodarchaeales archaeon]